MQYKDLENCFESYGTLETSRLMLAPTICCKLLPQLQRKDIRSQNKVCDWLHLSVVMIDDHVTVRWPHWLPVLVIELITHGSRWLKEEEFKYVTHALWALAFRVFMRVTLSISSCCLRRIPWRDENYYKEITTYTASKCVLVAPMMSMLHIVINSVPLFVFLYT